MNVPMPILLLAVLVALGGCFASAQEAIESSIGQSQLSAANLRDPYLFQLLTITTTTTTTLTSTTTTTSTTTSTSTSSAILTYTQYCTATAVTNACGRRRRHAFYEESPFDEEQAKAIESTHPVADVTVEREDNAVLEEQVAPAAPAESERQARKAQFFLPQSYGYGFIPALYHAPAYGMPQPSFYDTQSRSGSAGSGSLQYRSGFGQPEEEEQPSYQSPPMARFLFATSTSTSTSTTTTTTTSTTTKTSTYYTSTTTSKVTITPSCSTSSGITGC